MLYKVSQTKWINPKIITVVEVVNGSDEDGDAYYVNIKTNRIYDGDEYAVDCFNTASSACEYAQELVDKFNAEDEQC